MKRPSLPLAGVALSAILFVAATFAYPTGRGGSGGYDWGRDFVSTLFPATTPHGIPNPARLFAIPSMLAFCVSMAVVFWTLARRGPADRIGKAIEIGGIGAMVYAFLAVTTPMHDVLVSVSLAFFLTALVALLHRLRVHRRRGPLAGGLLCLAMLLGSAALYYGGVLDTVLPSAQKTTFAACTVWLLALHAEGPVPRQPGGPGAHAP